MTLEEQFLNIHKWAEEAVAGLWYIQEENLQKHCLDKQKVKEAIKKHIVYCCVCGCTFGRDNLLKELRLE